MLIHRSEIHYPVGHPTDSSQVLWRCEAKVYSTIVDAEREIFGTTTPRLEMWWHQVQRWTPQGAWICGRFILLTARKQWACRTEEEALESLRQRRKRQAGILRKRLERAEYELALTEYHLKKEPTPG
jgi:hypothetical protein